MIRPDPTVSAPRPVKALEPSAPASAPPAAPQTPPRRVNWLLSGPRTLASSRLQGYLIHEALLRRGWPSRLLMAPPVVHAEFPIPPDMGEELAAALAGEIVVFQKLLGADAAAFAKACRRHGVTSVFVQCDYFPDNPVPPLCDVVICPSSYLADRMRELGAADVRTIDDPAEAWEASDNVGPGPDVPGLRLCWVGIANNWPTLAPLRQILEEPDFADVTLTTVSNHPEADVPWSPEATRRVIAESHVGVVPVLDGPAARSKSSNRPVQFMALGRAVIAGKIDAYLDVIRDGENGLLCATAEEWRSALRRMRDPVERRRLARNAHREMQSRFSIEMVVSHWTQLFDSLPIAPAGSPSHVRRWLTLRRTDALLQTRFAFVAAEQEPAEARRRLRRAMLGLVLSPKLLPAWRRTAQRLRASAG